MSKRMAGLFLLSVVLLSTMSLIDCQDCTSQVTCGKCIGQAGCAWCYAEVFAGSRCQPREALIMNGSLCQPESIADPKSHMTVTRLSGDLNTIDVGSISLNLRVGDPQTFTVTVTPQRNLPLDLYILIDLSNSMQAELDVIRAIASQIATGVSNVTSNVRLGFGSFNDKPVAPFSRESIDPVNFPIPLDLYAVRHSVNMTSNSTTFAKELEGIMLSGNVDPPENGLEGLAQVITCEDIIGWRPRPGGIGTRVVLYMTDDEYHFAGEGRFAGIVTPYDGGCYLERNPENGNIEFVRSTEFDYPSVGQLLDILQDFDSFVIFAIQENKVQTYQNLADTILNANTPHASVLSFTIDSDDSGDTTTPQQILDQITGEYERLLQQVFLDHSVVDSSVDLSVVPTCPKNSSPEGDGCASVALESPVVFEITATLNTCEDLVDGEPTTYTITASSFGTFSISITPICNCECAREMDPEERSPETECSGFGVTRCGVCECVAGMCGDLCERNTSLSGCLRGGVNNEVCSGRGECISNCHCVCTQTGVDGQMILGNACQCDNFRCTLNDEGQVCSGRGECCNGVCGCGLSEKGNRYRGAPGSINNCQCEPEEEACTNPVTNITCNNETDTCGCNSCICQNRNYIGQFCDVPNVGTCPDFLRQFNDCIPKCRNESSNFSGKSLSNFSCNCHHNLPLIFVDLDISNSQLFMDTLKNKTTERLGDGDYNIFDECVFTNDRSNCDTEFYILSNDVHFAITALEKEECRRGSELVFAYAAFGVLPFLTGIFLIILIKISFTVLDYQEVKRWREDTKKADLSSNVNPLYQNPEIQYNNVAYKR